MQTTPKAAPPRRCATLAELVALTHGAWREPLRPGGVLDYAPPTRADHATRSYLVGRARVDTPPQGLACLPAARVHGAGVVLSADGALLARDVAEDFGKPEDAHWLLGHDGMRAPSALAGATAVVAVNRGAGYCHWLLEELPRLLALPRDAVDNVIAHAASEPARTAWARRGGREQLIDARRGTHLAVGPLWVPALAAYAGAPTPATVRAIREFADELGRERTEHPVAASLLYVSRARAARRRVTNEEELWRALEGLGFTRVFLEDHTWAGQIALMGTARVIVAAHGAGLANLVFCAPGARVVELVNAAYFNPVFWRLSALCGLDYRAVVSPGAEAGPIREERAQNREDILADVARVVKETREA